MIPFFTLDFVRTMLTMNVLEHLPVSASIGFHSLHDCPSPERHLPAGDKPARSYYSDIGTEV